MLKFSIYKHPFLVCLLAGIMLWHSGCIILVRDLEVTPMIPDLLSVNIDEPLRVHTINGEVILFEEGAVFESDSIMGSGKLYDLNLNAGTAYSNIASYPIAEVVALEYFTQKINAPGSVAASLVALPVTAFGVGALAVAIFGSCPTLYTTADSTSILEAELFSSSIVPLLEMRDVDRLNVEADEMGNVSLELRNEALETHYLNHLELIEVQHEPAEMAIADDWGNVWLLKDLIAPQVATDRSGRNVTRALVQSDTFHFATDERALRAVNEDDFFDEIELLFPPVKGDSVAIFLQLRNSLLSTVLLYDYLLAQQGVNAINWMAHELNTISGLVELGQFFWDLNLKIQVWDGSKYVERGRIGHIGPIAWDEIAIPIPVMTEDSLRIRLQFVADAWRIDQVAVSGSMRKGQLQDWPLTHVLDSDQQPVEDLLVKLGTSDDEYMVTFPGQRYTVGFHPEPSIQSRTFFLAGEGYYTEWIRGHWIQGNIAGKPFEASDATLIDALGRWASVRGDFEAQFFNSKIPVR